MLPQLGIKSMSAFIHLIILEKRKLPFQIIEVLHYLNYFELIVPLNQSIKLTSLALASKDG